MVTCPDCGSDQVTATKKGFGAGKAAAGWLCVGPVGLLGGAVGANKVMVTCLACGHTWAPGAPKRSALAEIRARNAERGQGDAAPAPLSYVTSILLLVFGAALASVGCIAIARGGAVGWLVMLPGAFLVLVGAASFKARRAQRGDEPASLFSAGSDSGR